MRSHTTVTTVFAVVMLLLVTSGVAEQSYPKARLLMEADELSASFTQNRFVILDPRSHEEFRTSHIPDARWLDGTLWRETFDDGKDLDTWSKRIGDLGISRDSTVVIYDDHHLKDASQLWFILRYFGVKDVRLLNGGWRGWVNSGRPLETTISAVAATEFVPEIQPKRLATKNTMLMLVQQQNRDRQIVDARSRDEFLGRDVKTNRRGGAIAGAINLEWSEVVDKTTDRFELAPEVAAIFNRTKIDLDQPVIIYCQSGRNASVMMFAMELMEAKDVQVYYKSWLEWGNDSDTPIVRRE